MRMRRRDGEQIAIVSGKVDWLFDLRQRFDAIKVAFDRSGFLKMTAVLHMQGGGKMFCQPNLEKGSSPVLYNSRRKEISCASLVN